MSLGESLGARLKFGQAQTQFGQAQTRHYLKYF